MTDINKLNSYSVEELLQELKIREAQTEATEAIASREPSEALQSFDSAAIAKFLKEQQTVIYGQDNRKDWFELSDEQKNEAECVVGLFFDTSIVDNEDGTSTIKTRNFGTAYKLCANEPFRDQPISAFCSGVLVASDVIATAGHCVKANDIEKVRFVFGFRMTDATTAQTVVDNNDIYSGVSIIDRKQVGNGPDWALVKLDRPVTNHPIATIRSAGKIADNQAVHVIGHPCGLPLKYASDAEVRSNTPKAFFVANLDTYGGNSGSPVFNSDTFEVEGLLVRGDNDFVTVNGCKVSLVCPDTGCRGEDCTRTTEFSALLEDSLNNAIDT